MNVINAKTENNTRFDSNPFDFITRTIAAMAMAINIQKINMVGAIRNPILLFFIKAIPAMINAGKHMAKSITCTGLINKPLSSILFGVIFNKIAGIISESQII